MQPWRHARVTARRAGRDWRGDLPIHEFMDMAKSACPDVRHRIVLHNSDLGPELAVRAFPNLPDARQIALDHVRQDIGSTPSLSHWLDKFDQSKLLRVRANMPDPDELISLAAQQQGAGSENDAREVWELLTLPVRLAPDFGVLALGVLMNGIGPVLARAVLGPARLISPGLDDEEVRAASGARLEQILRGLGVLANRHRSASGLEDMLRASFPGIDVSVLSCVSRRLPIPADQRLYLRAQIGRAHV